MTAVLVLLACLGSFCHEVRLPGEDGMQRCMLAGQHEAARYERQRPGMTVRQWRCEIGERS